MPQESFNLSEPLTPNQVQTAHEIKDTPEQRFLHARMHIKQFEGVHNLPIKTSNIPTYYSLYSSKNKQESKRTH